MKSIQMIPAALAALSIGWALLPTAEATGRTDKKAATDDTPFVAATEVGPPSLTHIKAGKVTIGTDAKTVQALLDESESRKGALRLLDAETPRKSGVKVSEFHMGTFEVTNEQFAAFVKATNRRPPEHWFGDALVDARTAFLEKEGLEARAAKTEGRSYKRKEWSEMIKNKWIEDNWETTQWKLPEGGDSCAVVFVNYRDAVEYADWAGLRLPTEQEWVYSARAEGDSVFTWGDEWSTNGRAHTAELNADKPRVVGSFPDGASPFGVQGLGGGVWEWTSSPYLAFDRFKPHEYRIKVPGKRKSEKQRREAKFNGGERVLKGGSRENSALAARIDFRQGGSRTETASALGFRVASSGEPGRDYAESLWRTVARPSVARKDESTLDFDSVLGLDRWTKASVAGKRPEGYEVITGYEAIVFAPRGNLDLKPGGEMSRTSRVWPVTFGILSTSVPMAKPALEPGTYFILYREKGKFLADPNAAEEADKKEEDGKEKKEDEKADEGPGEMTPEQRMLETIDTTKNLLIFVDAVTGEYVGSIPTPKLDDQQISKIETGISLEQKKEWVGATAATKVQELQDWLTFDARVPLSTKRAIPLSFKIQAGLGALGSGWRR